MSNDLIPLEKVNALQVFTTENGLDPIIQKIREEVEKEILDPSTEEGRRQIGSLARRVGSIKLRIKEMGQGLTEEWRKQTKAVTSETSRMEKEIDAIRDKVLAPRIEFERIRDERIAKFENAMQSMKDLAEIDPFMMPTSDILKERLSNLEKKYNTAPDGNPMNWEEFKARADYVYAEAKKSLKTIIETQEKHEKEQAELKRLQAEAKEREAEAERKRIADEAAEKARIKAEEEAEAKRQEQAKKEQAERDRIQAEADASAKREEEAKQALIDAQEKAEREKAEAIEAERKRQADEQAKKDAEIAKQKEIDEARAKDKEHRGKINKEAMESLIENVDPGLSEAQAKNIIVAIAKGLIPNITINY